MKSRNYLYATIRNLKLSRNNWRRKHKLLKDKYDIAERAVRYLVLEVAKQELEIRHLKEKESKINGWEAYREKYGQNTESS